MNLKPKDHIEKVEDVIKRRKKDQVELWNMVPHRKLEQQMYIYEWWDMRTYPFGDIHLNYTWKISMALARKDDTHKSKNGPFFFSLLC